jgi:hypothetical protein
MRGLIIAGAAALAALMFAASPPGKAFFEVPPYHGGFCADWRPPEWAEQAHCYIPPWGSHWRKE